LQELTFFWGYAHIRFTLFDPGGAIMLMQDRLAARYFKDILPERNANGVPAVCRNAK
jgi:hypothetical protein